MGAKGSVNESGLITNTSMSANDFVRIVEGSASRKITLTNFSAAIDAILVTLGFLKTANLPVDVVQSRVILVVTSNHNLVITNDVLLVDTTSGDVGINLLAAAGAFDIPNTKGQRFTIKKITTDVNEVTVTASGSETIDGNSDVKLLGGSLSSIDIISDGDDWHLI